eukprot:CAMPEP_0115575822 /NCGR_PEP_ID=MMETSP0272-20121206/2242_1 /TAXON_ID=71861 /ORGANISM="Scrippsiella trochoidea, Strain CCMP3099" /LENGTH=740 /DNA_ID=CAMNT_0003010589 /DNA_START=63 /DNA_END=2284 /DNA_ORIENTATION=-
MALPRAPPKETPNFGELEDQETAASSLDAPSLHTDEPNFDEASFWLNPGNARPRSQKCHSTGSAFKVGERVSVREGFSFHDFGSGDSGVIVSIDHEANTCRVDLDWREGAPPVTISCRHLRVAPRVASVTPSGRTGHLSKRDIQDDGLGIPPAVLRLSPRRHSSIDTVSWKGMDDPPVHASSSSSTCPPRSRNKGDYQDLWDGMEDILGPKRSVVAPSAPWQSHQQFNSVETYVGLMSMGNVNRPLVDAEHDRDLRDFGLDAACPDAEKGGLWPSITSRLEKFMMHDLGCSAGGSPSREGRFEGSGKPEERVDASPVSVAEDANDLPIAGTALEDAVRASAIATARASATARVEFSSLYIAIDEVRGLVSQEAENRDKSLRRLEAILDQRMQKLREEQSMAARELDCFLKEAQARFNSKESQLTSLVAEAFDGPFHAVEQRLGLHEERGKAQAKFTEAMQVRIEDLEQVQLQLQSCPEIKQLTTRVGRIEARQTPTDDAALLERRLFDLTTARMDAMQEELTSIMKQIDASQFTARRLEVSEKQVDALATHVDAVLRDAAVIVSRVDAIDSELACKLAKSHADALDKLNLKTESTDKDVHSLAKNVQSLQEEVGPTRSLLDTLAKRIEVMQEDLAGKAARAQVEVLQAMATRTKSVEADLDNLAKRMSIVQDELGGKATRLEMDELAKTQAVGMKELLARWDHRLESQRRALLVEEEGVRSLSPAAASAERQQQQQQSQQ